MLVQLYKQLDPANVDVNNYKKDTNFKRESEKFRCFYEMSITNGDRKVVVNPEKLL